MNKIYKIVWSRTKNCYVVASEFAKSNSRGTTSSKRSKQVKGVAVATAVLTTMAVSALSGSPVQAQAAIVSGATGIAISNSGSSATLANTSTSIAIGANTTANGVSAIAIGTEALVSTEHSVAIGTKATASGTQTVAIGSNAIAQGNQSLTIGGDVKTYGTGSVGIGGDDIVQALSTQFATSSGVSKSLGEELIALGKTVDKYGNYSEKNSSGNATVFVGSNAHAIGHGSLALGVSANANNLLSLAIGTASEALGDYAQAVGTAATATGDNSVAMGKAAKATGANTIAIGAGASVNGESSVAIGQGANIGTEDASVKQSIAIGQGAKVISSGGIAIGDGVTAGRGAKAGYDPVTGAATAKKGSAWNSGTSEMAIGHDAFTRQIAYVAAGAEDTDAANVAQLKAAQAAATTSVASGSNITASPSTNSTTGATTYTVSLNKNVDLTNTGSLAVGATTVNNAGVAANQLKVGTTTTVDNTGVTSNQIKAGSTTINPDGELLIK